MKVAIGGDHAGFEIKNEVAKLVGECGFEVLDVGAYQYDATDDYPDLAPAVAEAVVARKTERGIVVRGGVVGASVAANKIVGARAAPCHDTYSAHQGVEHDDLNVLYLGSRVIGVALAGEIVRAYLLAQFSGKERHQRRLNKVLAAEGRQFSGSGAK